MSISGRSLGGLFETILASQGGPRYFSQDLSRREFCFSLPFFSRTPYFVAITQQRCLFHARELTANTTSTHAHEGTTTLRAMQHPGASWQGGVKVGYCYLPITQAQRSSALARGRRCRRHDRLPVLHAARVRSSRVGQSACGGKDAFLGQANEKAFRQHHVPRNGDSVGRGCTALQGHIPRQRLGRVSGGGTCTASNPVQGS